ncbi:MAG: bifunctional metallophosphatase/5'-nucleotidase [Ruminococcus sp.]|nr:bifunctional metallophosphatase/5'-nucleotidase [Ruminococcus sp.]
MFEKKIKAVCATMAATVMVSSLSFTAFGLSANAEYKGVKILYTNDVHNAYEQNLEDGTIGYAAAAQYKKDLEADGWDVILVDAGDAIQGGLIGTLSKGSYIVDIMGQTGYSLAVPGNHEFDFGMENFLSLAEGADYEYICCNFMDLRTNETVFEPYEIVTLDGMDIAFVGIDTPEAITKSTPAYFKDEDGSYIYGFCQGNDGQNLYDAVQDAVDDAIEEGADYVVAIGHTGTDTAASSPYTSIDIIENTTDIDSYIDAHSHTVLEGETYNNKDGEDVLLTSTGSYFQSLGEMTITSNGELSSSLVLGITEQDPETLSYVNSITASFEELKNTVVASSEVKLVTNDPNDEDSFWMVRNQETNLGDLCADAYRIMLGADIGIINGGNIRAEIDVGDVTYEDIIDVSPYGNTLCVVEATGQQILDALEMGAMVAGEDNSGGFWQVSGLTYEIDTRIESSVVKDDEGMFVKVTGDYRVRNVYVGDEPLELDKTYTLASHNYLLKQQGDGFNMFDGSSIIQDEVMIDNQALIDYITDYLGGTISANSIYSSPYGEGRIRVITDELSATCTEDGYVEYIQGASTVRQTLEAAGHSFGEWEITTEASVGVEGEMTRTCTECGYTETQIIAALEDDSSSEQASSSSEASSEDESSDASSDTDSSSSSEASSEEFDTSSDLSSSTSSADTYSESSADSYSDSNPMTGAALPAAAVVLALGVLAIYRKQR